MTLDDALNDIENIPNDKALFIRSNDPCIIAHEVINVNGTLSPTGKIITDKSVIDTKTITSGNIFNSLSPRGSVFNGGLAITDSLNRFIGIQVPKGSTGSSSYICSDIPANIFQGRKIRITQTYKASDNWLSVVSLNSLRAQFRAGNTVTSLVVKDYSIVQNGNIIVQTGTVIVPYSANYVGLVIQYASNASAKLIDLAIQLMHTSFVIVTDLGSVVTENDEMLALQLAPVTIAATTAQNLARSSLLVSGNIWNNNELPGKGRGAALNGAITVTDAVGNIIGLRIPAKAGSGQSSYLTSWFSAAGMKGYTLDIFAEYKTSAKWNIDSAPNTLALQVLRSNGNVNINDNSGVIRSITQSDTTMKITLRYTVKPDDINIGVCYQIAGGSAIRDYDRSMQIISISYTVVPAVGETLNNAMLSIFIDKAISQMQNGGETVIVNVKPSGGDYTHPKLALDHITDATALKRYVIAVYPGNYTGYSEFQTKNHVDIVGMGRKEEIVISYDCGDSADEDTVKNTSLIWMASETLLKNLTLKIKNGRYCIHMEGNGSSPNVSMAIEDCSIIHEGNAHNTYWWQPSQYGVGAGLSAGNTVRLRNSYFEGRGGGFSFHTPNNRVAYTTPITVDIEGCTFRNSRTMTNTGYPYEGAFWIKPITKGSADTCRLVGNTFINGQVYYTTGEWLDKADTTTHRAQVAVWGYSNVGFSFYSNEEYTPNMTGIHN